MSIPRLVRKADPTLPFTEEDSNRAYNEWGASCGPHSIAAALGVPLERVRSAVPGFKGWMNPTMVRAALNVLGVHPVITRNLRTKELYEGINRIQWEGPWLDAGVPARVAYFHTHWVAVRRTGEVLCTCMPWLGWTAFDTWKQWIEVTVLPEIPRSTGWHVTHHYSFSVENRSPR